MLARFARDALTYGGTAAAIKAVGFLLLPIYTRFLSPADYGMVDLLMIVAAFAFVTVALEVGQGAARYLPGASTAQRAEYVSASLAFGIPAYGLFAVALWLSSDWVALHFLGHPEAGGLVQVAAVTIALMGVFQLASGELRWMMQSSRYAAISIAYALTSGVVGIVLVAGLRVGPVGMLLGWAAGAVVGLALVAIAGRGIYRIRWDRERLGQMLRFSLPLVPSGVAVILMTSADRLIVNSTLDLDDVGVYSVGLRIASMAAIVMLAFQASLTPIVYAAHADAGTPRAIGQLFRAFVSAAGAASVGIALFAPEIVALVAGPEFSAARQVVPILATATFIGGMYIFAPGLAIAKRTGMIATISISAALVTTIGSLVLVPVLGIVGGAIAALLGGASLFAGNVVLGGRQYPVAYEWPRVAIVGLIVLAADLVALSLDMGALMELAPRVIVALGCLALIATIGPIRVSEFRIVMSRLRGRWQRVAH